MMMTALAATPLWRQCLADCDITVLRHPISGSMEQVLQVVTSPIINAGDGAHEHPDACTIYNELGVG